MSVFMKYGFPAVGGAEIHQDEILVGAVQVKAHNLDRLALIHGSKLAYLLLTFHGDYPQGGGGTDLVLQEELGKHGTHLLELERNFAAPFFAAISKHREVGRLYFHPLLLRARRGRPEAGDHEGQKCTDRELHERPM